MSEVCAASFKVMTAIEIVTVVVGWESNTTEKLNACDEFSTTTSGAGETVMPGMSSSTMEAERRIEPVDGDLDGVT